MTFDVTTNRIPFGLLTPEEQATLKAWPHGWERVLHSNLCTPVWCEADTPNWGHLSIYRGKPAPKITSYWFNIYAGDEVGIIWTSQDAAATATKLAPVPNNVITMRMDICNGEVTVTKET